MPVKVKYFLLFFFLINLSLVRAQTTSPYTFFGLGNYRTPELIKNFSMGGTGIALSDSIHLNFLNPASLSNQGLATLEAGVFAEGKQFKTSDLTSTGGDMNIAYLALGVPVLKDRIGISIGLSPFAGFNYNIIDEETLQDTALKEVTIGYFGNGTLYRAMIATGIKPVKLENHSLSVGIKASYIFGTVRRVVSQEYPEVKDIFNNRYKDFYSVSDFLLDYGAQYTLSLNDKYRLTLGGTASFTADLSAIRNRYIERYSVLSTGQVNIKDTTYQLTDDEGVIIFPSCYGGGIAFEKPGSWIITGDFTTKNWSQFRFFEQPDSVADNWLVSFGGRYRLNQELKKKPFTLKGGFFFGKDFLSINGRQLDKVGITFGIDIPLRNVTGSSAQKNYSIISLAIEAGQRGTVNNNLIQEKYIRGILGVTLSDKWFHQRKFN